MNFIAAPAQAQRTLGVDISYWNRGSSSGSSDGISQSAWNTAFNTPDQNGNTRTFVVIRASRGGTTGTNVSSGTPGNPSTPATLSQRYDDPDFARNITRAANSGFIAGAYHFGRPEVSGNTGTDEANHFLESASAWMRPGYMMPMYDMESGSGIGGDALAQFAIDFSDRLYNVMGIRPSMYINGNYSSILQGANATRRAQLAQPVNPSLGPTMVGPAYPMLWDARYSDNANSAANYAIPVQTGSPKTTYTTISSYYGPWDDYGNASPWGMWQYGSVQSIPGFNTVDATVDGDVSHGDIEYVKDMMVPAVWWNNSSGSWGTMTNWNSGQTIGSFASGNPFPTAPYTAAGQYPAVSGGVLPVPRLPGTAGSGPAITSGVNDTVILERPSANITVTLSSGTYNIRKLYMRETLSLTGGSLTINYDPLYNFNVGVADSLRSGPISAQFSGPVSISGSAALTVPALQVDADQTFTLAGGTVTFNKITLGSNTKMLVTGNVALNPFSNSNPRYTSRTASISGAGGSLDLGGGTRTFTIGNVADAVDMDIAVPLTNGGLTKSGAGTLRLSGNNTLGPVAVNAGTLLLNGANTTGAVSVASGGTLGGTGSASGAATIAGSGIVSPGASVGTLTLGGADFGAGSTFLFEMRDATGLSGAGYDRLNVLNQFAVSAGTTAGTQCIIDINTIDAVGAAGLALNFNAAVAQQWVLAHADGGITGFDVSEFKIDRSGFLNSAAGVFSVAASSNDLLLVYSVPEPSGVAMLGLAALGLGARRRKSATRIAL